MVFKVMQDALRQFKADIFQALANPTRVAIVELLRDRGETPVTHIQDALRIEQANVSQHLSVLRSKNIVLARKEGNQVFYRLRDPMLGKVLDILKQYFHQHVKEAMATLRQMAPPKEVNRK